MSKSVSSWYWRDPWLSGMQFTLTEYRVERQDPHRHFGYSLTVYSENARIRTRHGVCTVPAGSLVRVAPNVWHAVEVLADTWQERGVFCSTAVARSALEVALIEPRDVQDRTDICLYPSDAIGVHFAAAHRALLQAHMCGSEANSTEARFVLCGIIADIIPIDEAVRSDLAIDDPMLASLYQIISSDFRSPIPLDAMAGRLGWHPVYLHRRCKQILGFTPRELVVGHRLEYARDLIAGGAEIVDAAVRAGFFDEAHLHRNFILAYGPRPGQYKSLVWHDQLQPSAARNGTRS